MDDKKLSRKSSSTCSSIGLILKTVNIKNIFYYSIYYTKTNKTIYENRCAQEQSQKLVIPNRPALRRSADTQYTQSGYFLNIPCMSGTFFFIFK